MLRQPPGPRDGRAVAVYTLARAGLLLVCLVLGWVAGLSGPFLLIVALLVSGGLSWFLLQRQRLAMGSVVERRVSHLRDRIDARAAAEDAYVDSLRPASHADEVGASHANARGMTPDDHPS